MVSFLACANSGSQEMQTMTTASHQFRFCMQHLRSNAKLDANQCVRAAEPGAPLKPDFGLSGRRERRGLEKWVPQTSSACLGLCQGTIHSCPKCAFAACYIALHQPMLTALTAAALLTPTDRISDAVVLMEDATIRAFGPRSAIDLPPEAKAIDYGDAVLAPAFVDTHIHGAAGHDVMEGTPSALSAI